MATKDFTPKLTQESKCRTCQHNTRILGRSFKDEINYCQALRQQVPFVVTDCNAHRSINAQSLYQMYQEAWPLATKGDRIIGFKSPREFRELADGGKADRLGQDREYDF